MAHSQGDARLVYRTKQEHAVTLAQLLRQLEGCHTDAEVRIGVNGTLPTEHALLGVTSTLEIGHLHIAGRGEPGVVWLLGTRDLGALTSLAFHPRYRHQP